MIILGNKEIGKDRFYLINIDSIIYYARYTEYGTLWVGKYDDHKLIKIRNVSGNLIDDLTNKFNHIDFNSSIYSLSHEWRNDLDLFRYESIRLKKVNEFLSCEEQHITDENT